LTQRLEDLEMDRERHFRRPAGGGGGGMIVGSGRGQRNAAGANVAPGSMMSPARVQYPSPIGGGPHSMSAPKTAGVYSPPVVLGYPSSRQQTPAAKRDY
jgi:hypothetical protein